MIHELRLTDIGEGLEEAEIVSWLVQVGDHVNRDQPLIEVLTDKSNAELPAPVTGTVVELAGAVGDIVHVGGLIAVIDDAVDASPRDATPAAAPVAPVAPGAPGAVAVAETAELPGATAPAPVPESAALAGRRPKASPSTRRAAAELGVDLSSVIGSGPGGRILLADLNQATSPPPAPPAPSVAPASPPAPAVVATPSVAPASPPAATEPAAHPQETPQVIPAVTPSTSTTAPQVVAHDKPAHVTPTSAPDAAARTGVEGTIPLRGIRRVVAQNMTKAWAEIPHIHAFDHIDAEPLLEMRTRLKETQRQAYDHLTPLSFFVAAVARALTTHRQANGSLSMADQTITHHPHVNVGIAVAAPQGLVVPVLRGAEQLDFETLSLTLSALIRGARDGSLSREHFQGGTVTITNFGSLGGEQAIPIIRAPESMIFGFGSIEDRPFVIEDEVVARKTMHLVAGADHRLLDGDITTAVLNDVAESLNDPLRLVL